MASVYNSPSFIFSKIGFCLFSSTERKVMAPGVSWPRPVTSPGNPLDPRLTISSEADQWTTRNPELKGFHTLPIQGFPMALILSTLTVERAGSWHLRMALASGRIHIEGHSHNSRADVHYSLPPDGAPRLPRRWAGRLRASSSASSRARPGSLPSYRPVTSCASRGDYPNLFCYILCWT